ncbi:MAG: AsmA-like C-terminal region-containing protein [Myxococcota bacterium]
MRRSWRAFALAAFLLVILGLALASARALSRLESPAAELVAATLSRILDRPVEVGHAELRFGLSLGIEVYDLRVMEPDDSERPPAFEVAYARGEQSWPRVLVGQVVPLNWDIESPTLRIHTGVGGASTLTPPELPALNLDLRDGRVEWYRANGDLFVMDELILSARRSAFGIAMHGSVRGRLSRAEHVVSRFDMRVDGRPTNFSVKGAISGLELDQLPTGPVVARGVGKGEIALAVRRGVIEARAALTFAGLELELPDLSAPLVPENNRLNLDITYAGDVLSFDFNRVELDDLVMSGHTTYRAGPKPHVSAKLTFETFEPASSPSRLQPLRILGLRYASWERTAERVKSGRIEGLSIRFDAPLERLADVFAFRDHVSPKELEIEFRARDGVYLPNPDSAPLERISGDIAIRGNTLEVRGLRIQREGRDLPRIDAWIDGMHRLVRLPEEERGTPRGPGTPIPGLDAAASALRSPAAPERAETVIRFADAEIHYPAFIFPFRAASGLLRFPQGKLVVERANGILGGAPADLDVVWDPGGETIDLRIKYLDLEVEPRAGRPREWLKGHISSDELYFGSWRVGDLDAQIDVRGADVRASAVRGRLLDGKLSGGGALSLAEEERAAFEFDLVLDDADAAELEPHLGLPPESLTGKLAGNGRLAGALEPERRYLDYWDIELNVTLEDGNVGNLPPALVLARLPSLRGVRGLLGRALPYETIDTVIAIKGGALHVADFKLIGPELRILASGEIDLTTDDYYTDMTVAVLFLRTLDRLLGALPIVRDIVLGPEKNLLAAYFHVSGPMAELDAAFLAPKTIESTFGMLSGAIKASVKQLIKIIPGRRSGDEDRDTASGEDNRSGAGQDPQP